MAPTYNERLADKMRELFWENILKKVLEVWQPVLKIPVLGAVLEYILRAYLLDPLFLALTRFGVFTSIEWRTLEEYSNYKDAASKLIAMEGEEPDEKIREEFRKAAADLIILHPLI